MEYLKEKFEEGRKAGLEEAAKLVEEKKAIKGFVEPLSDALARKIRASKERKRENERCM